MSVMTHLLLDLEHREVPGVGRKKTKDKIRDTVKNDHVVFAASSRMVNHVCVGGLWQYITMKCLGVTLENSQAWTDQINIEKSFSLFSK